MHCGSGQRFMNKLAFVCFVLLPVAACANQCYPTAKAAYDYLLYERQASEQYRININTASAVDFMSLDGVGVATAEAIVAYRSQVGRFSNIDELMLVKGIGEKTLAKNRHRLTVQ